ncbi:MAG: dihydrodipicolinate synthase family protein [Actinomycetaceae bacterium]
MSLIGLHAALIATYDDSGAFSAERQGRLIDHVLGQGLDGVFVSGSTGEAYLQSIAERRESISAAVDQVAGRGVVIGHVGAMDTRGTIELAEHAVAAGVDAVSAVTPIYYQYSEAQLEQYFRDVAAASGPTPVVAYHIPGRTHVELSPTFFLRLADDGVIQALKYTSTDVYPLAEVARRAPEDLVVLNGSDEVLLGGLVLGARGGIGSTYNAIGSIYRKVVERHAAGDLAGAGRAQWRANRFIEAMNHHDFLVFLRQVLRHDGVKTGVGRAPLPAVTAEQQRHIDEFLTTFRSEESSS